MKEGHGWGIRRGYGMLFRWWGWDCASERG